MAHALAVGKDAQQQCLDRWRLLVTVSNAKKGGRTSQGQSLVAISTGRESRYLLRTDRPL